MRLSNRGKLHRNTDDNPAPSNTRPLVQLHDVSLTQARTTLLTQLDLTIHPGEHVALVGLCTTATTALTQLLTGRTNPTHGRITTHTPAHVLPPGHHRTLAHTITGHTDPAHDEPALTHVLSRAGLSPEHLATAPADLPPELQPLIHQARALYAAHTGARLLVLTEGPAATGLDPATGLLLLTRQPTHARHAHRVLLLDNGRVTETGTHRQLLLRGGAYARLYALHGQHRTSPDHDP